MNRLRGAALLLLVQLVLVSSIAAKYLYERRTYPRIWVRSAQYDPNLPLRGRYFALQLLVDACQLPHDTEHAIGSLPYGYTWDVTLSVKNGHLVPILRDRSGSHGDALQLRLLNGWPCDRSTLSPTSEYFIPDKARSPFPLQPGQELWVNVTVPPNGPPRPIQLALSSKASFQPLTF